MAKKKQKKKKKSVKEKQIKKKKAEDKEEYRPFTNDFVFALVMRDPNVCKGIVELILPDEEIGEVNVALSDDALSKLKKKPEVTPQASLDFGKRMRGVRFENGLVPICVSILMERPSANGSPDCQRQAGYEPTAYRRRVPTLRSNSLRSLLSVLPNQA